MVDVRTDHQFDDAHVPGSVSNTMLRSGFGTKLAWLADRGQEIVLRGARRRRRPPRGPARRGGRACDNLGGFLAGGMTSWRAEDRGVAGVERIDVDGLHARGDGVQILDVREAAGVADGHIPGSVLCPTTTSTRCRRASIRAAPRP